SIGPILSPDGRAVVKLVARRYYGPMAHDRVRDLLERLGTLLRAEDRKLGAERGLQPIHLQVLRYLSACNRYSDTPGAVGEYFGLTKGTVSQSLLLLEDRGLLRRVPDEHDGRLVHLKLTARGRSAAVSAPGEPWEAAVR